MGSVMALLLELRAKERVCGHRAEAAESQHQEYEIEHLGLRPSSRRQTAPEPHKSAMGNAGAKDKDDIKIAGLAASWLYSTPGPTRKSHGFV